MLGIPLDTDNDLKSKVEDTTRNKTFLKRNIYNIQNVCTLSSISPLVVFATVDGLSSRGVLVIRVKHQSLGKDHLAIKVTALVSDPVRDVGCKQAPFVATSVLSCHLQENLPLIGCPVARPLLLTMSKSIWDSVSQTNSFDRAG